MTKFLTGNIPGIVFDQDFVAPRHSQWKQNKCDGIRPIKPKRRQYKE